VISVLYVDDEPALLDLTRRFLERDREYSVDCAVSARIALEKISSRPYDVIVSDYQMPGMDGISFLKSLRASGNSTPFIIFTGKGREEVVIQALNEGADFYLQKGGDPNAQFAELAHKVRQAVQQQRAEARIRDHEQREADIINFLPDATFAIDTSGQVIAWNRAMEKMTGVSAGDMLGKGAYEYAIPFYRERRPILIDLIFGSQEMVAGKYPYIRKEGDRYFSEIFIPHLNGGKGAHLWFTASPLYDTAGRIVGAIESIRDITERKAAEVEATSGRKLVEGMLDGIPDIIGLQLPDHTVIRYNRKGYEALAMTPEQVVGKKCYELIGRTGPCDSCATTQAVITKKTAHIEKFFPELQRFFACTSTPVLDENGEVELIIERLLDITERRRAEEALRESEEDYRHLFENATEGILIAQGDRLVRVNPLLAEMLGHPAGYIMARPFTDFIHPDDREMVQDRHIRRMLGEDVVPRYSFRVVTGNGEIRWAEITATRITWSGNPASLSFIVDITERRRAEEALLESQENYRRIVDTAAEGIWQIDEQSRITYVNRRMADMLGYTRGEMVGADVTSFMPPGEHVDSVFRKDQQRKGVVDHFERQYIRKDGSILWTRVAITPIIGADGTYHGSFAMLSDITDRKEAEAALRKSEERLALALSAANEGIWDWNLVTHTAYFSPQYYQMLGYEPNEFPAGYEAWRSLVHPDDIERCEREIFASIGQREGFSIEFRLRMHDGAWKWILGRGKAVERDAQGAPVRMVGTHVDITDRKQAEEALRLAHHKISLLGSITRHDIQNQLAALNGFLELVQEEISDPAYEHHFSRITHATGRIADIVRFNKTYEQVGVHTPAWHEVRLLAESAARQGSSGIPLVNELPPGTAILADPLVHTVFANLMENAVRHGGTVSVIRFRAGQREGDLVIACEDDGSGIPAAEKEKIFAREFGKNTGYGLFLAREILAITDITIRETGEPGKGACFEVVVPQGAWRRNAPFGGGPREGT